MKTILCYGDSNTWGFAPENGLRYPFASRWTGVLQEKLCPEFKIVESGLNGRTTSLDDPNKNWRNGTKYLPLILETTKPIDLVIIMLGTNDLKTVFDQSPQQIAKNIELMVQDVQSFYNEYGVKCPQILIVSPTLVELDNGDPDFLEAKSKSQQFSELYREVANCNNCHFLDAAKIIKSSPVDGIHLSEESHEILGNSIGDKVFDIFHL